MRGDLPYTMFGDFENDFKAEVVAAELAENGIPAERILILMLGSLKRTYSKDVAAIEEELSEYDHKEYTLVKTHKEGIYDMLPEGLFHRAGSHKSVRSEKEIIKMMKQRRQEEQAARKFFLPFEAAINYLRMQMAMYENRLDKRSHYDDLVNIFKEQWEIFQWLDARQANIFLHLIPIMHELRDDYPVIENIMQMIFSVPVKICLREQAPLYPGEPFFSRLGEVGLGVSFAAGAVYNEGEDEVLITIGPISNQLMQQFMHNNRNEKILQLLIDYFLPVHLDTVTEFVLNENEKTARLADAASELNSELGVDVWL